MHVQHISVIETTGYGNRIHPFTGADRISGTSQIIIAGVVLERGHGHAAHQQRCQSDCEGVVFHVALLVFLQVDRLRHVQFDSTISKLNRMRMEALKMTPA